jgi:hypothetical protein
MLTGPAPSSLPGTAARAGLEPFPATSSSVRAMYGRLRLCGLTEAQAGNLTARATGLSLGRRTWRLEEIQGLLFLRALVEDGRLDS